MRNFILKLRGIESLCAHEVIFILLAKPWFEVMAIHRVVKYMAIFVSGHGDFCRSCCKIINAAVQLMFASFFLFRPAYRQLTIKTYKNLVKVIKTTLLKYISFMNKI